MEKENWTKAKAVMTKDFLNIDGFQVMQSWESNYMKMLASIVTKNGGNVLEIGFGMGISARFIQGYKRVKKHVIIEAHPNVFNYANRIMKDDIKKGRVKIIRGFWQDAIKELKDEQFDGMLFDPYPLSKKVNKKEDDLLLKEAYRILKKGGILTFYDSESNGLSRNHIKELKDAGFQKIDYKLCKVRPPKNCGYWKHNTITAPIIVK